MKFPNVLLFYFLTICLSDMNAIRNCDNTDPTCLCINNPDNYEYQCKRDETEDHMTIIHVYPQARSVDIECPDKVERLTLNDLPHNQNFEDVTKLEVKFCPLPDGGFRTIGENFKTQKLEYLSFKHGVLPNNATLPQESFAELPSVIRLILSSNDLRYMEAGVLRNFPDLVYLDLFQNKLQLESGMFGYVPKLRVLILSSNNLKSFPDNVFVELNVLEKLELWKNDIVRIEDNTFAGLFNLTFLELSFNKIESISESAFRNLTKLVTLSLRSNNLKNISREIFSDCSSLGQVQLNGNVDMVLLDNVFSNFPQLKSVSLGMTRLTNLPEELFRNSTNVIRIELEHNNLTTIPEKVFYGLERLEFLDLSYNHIDSLNSNIFQTLIKLKLLDLRNNFLTQIGDILLRPLRNLESINLSRNQILNIHLDCLSNNSKLKTVDMSYNQYNPVRVKGNYFTPFKSCPKLEELDLSNNMVEDFPEDVLFLDFIKNVNLDYNKITSLRVNTLQRKADHDLKISLQHNNISRVNFEDVEQTAATLDFPHSSTLVDISFNPFNCDCYALDLMRYIKDQMHPSNKVGIKLLHKNLICAGPKIFEEISVEQISPMTLTCPLQHVVTDNISNICDIIWRPFDATLIVDCSYKNITVIPAIHLPKRTLLGFNQTEIHLEGNLLERGPSGDDIGFENAIKLYLNNNHLRNLTWMPSELRVLDLSNNSVEQLDSNILWQLNNMDSFSLSLADNPWRCDCATTNFTDFLRRHLHQVDTTQLRCNRTGQLLTNLNRNNLCKDNSKIIMIFSIVMGLTFFMITLIAALYYKFHQEVKVWLFARGLCLFFVKEEELDKDKLYDAFISYSHKDEDFVVEKMVAELESGPHPYRLCLHYRDWIPGEYIATQVANSVHNSRRTLVVLSPSFIESVWGKMEFRTAHTQAMSEGRTRVIVVLYGDVDVEKLDDGLKTYLKTNTYIKWGDPWFWNKLRYALPHSASGEARANGQKHANVMQFIDDKFSLMKPSGNSDPGSTPPYTLDPSLLKGGPRKFEFVETPSVTGGLQPLVGDTIGIK